MTIFEYISEEYYFSKEFELYVIELFNLNLLDQDIKLRLFI